MADNQKLQNLFDFSDLKNTHRISPSHISDQIDITSENEGILRSFKELRDKLKMMQKQNTELKQQIKIKDIKIRQNHQSLEAVLLNNIQLKDQLSNQKQSHQQLKKRIYLMKDTINKFKTVQQQLTFTKNTLLQAKMQTKSMLQEKSKMIELSIQQKMNLQESITMLQAKTKSNQQYIGHLQNELANTKQKNIKLQNQIRKMSISYEQQTFTNQWSRQNFQTEYLKETINQKQEVIASLKAKNKKEKEKRAQLEERLIELEELSGLNQVKADIFEGETELVTKKQNKYEKKVADLLKKIADKNQQNLILEQEVTKIALLFEEVLKSLKNQNYSSLNNFIIEYQGKIKSINNNSIKEVSIQNITKRPNETMKNVLQENNYNNFSSNNSTYNKYSSNKIVDPKSQTMPYNSQTTFTTGRFTFGYQKQNQPTELSAVQNKIRRQREQMQKKIKQKYFQKKIEASMPSELHKLRGQYIRTFIDKL